MCFNFCFCFLFLMVLFFCSFLFWGSCVPLVVLFLLVFFLFFFCLFCCFCFFDFAFTIIWVCLSVFLSSFVVMGFTAGLVLKNPPLMQKAPVWSLSWKDPLEKAMAIYSIIVALKIPLTEEPCDLQSMRYGELQSICCYWCSFLFLLFTFGFVCLFTFFSFFFFFFVFLFYAQHSL